MISHGDCFLMTGEAMRTARLDCRRARFSYHYVRVSSYLIISDEVSRERPWPQRLAVSAASYVPRILTQYARGHRAPHTHRQNRASVSKYPRLTQSRWSADKNISHSIIRVSRAGNTQIPQKSSEFWTFYRHRHVLTIRLMRDFGLRAPV